MNDKDKMVVKNFVIAGLSLESLFACFPEFPKDEITKIFNSFSGDYRCYEGWNASCRA